ncbi:hypothetical protein WJX77_002906 [Trebouxia sp. C0004]
MGGVPFAFVANLQFQHFLHCLRPSFVPPGQTMLRGSLLDENIAEIVIKIMNQYGPKKFTGIVTDNARSIVNMRTIVAQSAAQLNHSCNDSYQDAPHTEGRPQSQA